MSTASPEVVKWFTRARRFPQLIGRTPDGARLWGGPYTVTQVAGAGAFLFLGTRTMGWWARYGLLSNALLLLSVTYGLVLLLGRIPIGARNPWSIALGALRVMTAPTSGRLAGRPIRLRRPHLVRHRIVMQQQTARPAATKPSQPPCSTPDTTSSTHPATALPGPAPARRTTRALTRRILTATSRWRTRRVPDPIAPTQLAAPNSRPTPTPTGSVLSDQTIRASPSRAAAAAIPATQPEGRRSAPALTSVQQLLAKAAATSTSPPPTTSAVSVLPRPAGSRTPENP